MQIQSAPPQRPLKNWSLVGHIDATSNLEMDELRNAACLQTIDSQDVNVVMEIQRKAYKARKSPDAVDRGLDRTAGITQAAFSATSFAIAGMSLVNHPLIAAGAGLAGLATAYFAGKNLMRSVPPPALKQGPPRHANEPAWEGTRVLELSASSGRSPLKLDSPTVSSNEKLDPPTPQELGHSLAEMMKAYPSKHQAVLLAGHGNAFHGWSHYSMDQLAEALGQAVQESGRKIDLVIFDSCLMGNMEGLSKLAPHAQYAVASEEIVYTGHRAWDLVFNEMGGAQADPRQLGQTIVKQFGGHWEGRTMSLIDLGKLEPLKETVEDLGEKLLRDVKGPERNAIAEALDVHTFGTTYTGSKEWGGYGDLGNVLENLEQKVTRPDTKEAVESAQRALKAAVVGYRNQMCYDHARGLSARVPTHNFEPKVYQEKTGMEKWGQLMSEMRPAPRDRTIINHRSIL
ncbi:MAG: hypothetical protein J0I12_24735 [Candidatus Eremiobacteraeota bacterium]|nr:hypothetical protein [Candidatus Eremiobacteraeota bacterium]